MMFCGADHRLFGSVSVECSGNMLFQDVGVYIKMKFKFELTDYTQFIFST